MAEQHLHHAQIRTMIEQMRGESMAQRVGRQRLADPGNLGLVLDAVPERLTGHLFATLTGEQHITGPPAEQFTARVTHVALDPHNRLLPHRHQALLAALAHHPQHALAQVDLLQGQTDQLGHPQTAGVQHLQHRAVALADGFAQIRSIEQGLHVGFRQGFRQRPTQLRHIDLQGRVESDEFFPQQIAIKPTHTGKESRGGAWLVVLLQTPGQVIEDQLAAGVDQFEVFFLQPAVEQRQVAAVGLARVV